MSLLFVFYNLHNEKETKKKRLIIGGNNYEIYDMAYVAGTDGSVRCRDAL